MIKLITHTDLDGVSCYLIASYFYGKKAIDVEYVNYKNVDETIINVIKEHNNYDYIYITDISCNEETAKMLDTIKYKVKLLDHHKTALYLNEYEWGCVKLRDTFGSIEVNSSGSQMFFMHLHRKFKINEKSHEIDNYASLVKYIEYVRKYDTWDWFKLEEIEPKKFNDLFRVLGRDRFIKNIEEKLFNNSMEFTELDNLLLDIVDEKKEKYLNDKKDLLIETTLEFNDKLYNVGIVAAEDYISELGNYLSTEFPNLDFVAIITPNSISYRTSKEDVDLSLIAQLKGGGGHTKASGSPLDKTLRDKFLIELIK